jgi:hypothetical protein
MFLSTFLRRVSECHVVGMVQSNQPVVLYTVRGLEGLFLVLLLCESADPQGSPLRRGAVSVPCQAQHENAMGADTDNFLSR